MEQLSVKDFFDQCAENWDQKESHSVEEKRRLIRKIGIQKGDKVLDIACGTGVITRLLHEESQDDVVGIDISKEMVKVAKEKYKNDSWASFHAMDFLDHSYNCCFDVAVIYNAFPHFMDVKALSKALSKSLKKGGKFAIFHSLSRQELDKHHAYLSSNLSRSLKEATSEAKSFEEDFLITFCEESEHSFFISGCKK